MLVRQDGEILQNNIYFIRMNRLLIALAFASFTACDTAKTTVSESTNNDEKVSTPYSIGQVVLNEDGCPVYVRLDNSGMKLYPVHLDEMFHVDQAWLQFKWESSRAPQPEACSDTRPAVLSEVVRLKR
jgi:hypothetical protein